MPDIYVLVRRMREAVATTARRFEVRYKGKNIADVLDMTVGEAKDFMSSIPSAKRKLETLSSVGLDYVQPRPVSYDLVGR